MILFQNHLTENFLNFEENIVFLLLTLHPDQDMIFDLISRFTADAMILSKLPILLLTFKI